MRFIVLCSVLLLGASVAPAGEHGVPEPRSGGWLERWDGRRFSVACVRRQPLDTEGVMHGVRCPSHKERKSRAG